jgi:hypothetical protein
MTEVSSQKSELFFNTIDLGLRPAIKGGRDATILPDYVSITHFGASHHQSGVAADAIRL